MRLLLYTKYNPEDTNYALDLAKEVSQTIQELSDLQDQIKTGMDTTGVDPEFISNLKKLDFENLGIGLDTDENGITALTLD